MKLFDNSFRVTELLKGVEGTLALTEDTLLDNASELEEATTSSLCFYENEQYSQHLNNLKAGLLIVPQDFNKDLLTKGNLFYTIKPYLTFNKVVSKWLQLEKKTLTQYLHPSVVVGENCSIGKNVILNKNVVVGDNSKIGDGSVLESNTVIGNNVSIGENCLIYPNTNIYDDTIIQNRVTIHSGSTIGSDGFGYIFSDNRQQKIHHVGKVVIEDDVEIGANTCIDRGTLGVTKVGIGTKIDNLVQIGHNCKIGRHSILCAQVGLAGNTQIGDYVYLAGQVGAAGHLTIGDRAMIGAQSGISGNIPAGKKYLGTPAFEAGLQKRIIVSLKKLPAIVKLFNKLNRQENK